MDEEATRKVEQINSGKRIMPTVIINGESYSNPDNAEPASVLGINEVARVVLYRADWCPDCRRSKAYLQNNNINYQYIDIEENEWAIPIIEKLNEGRRRIPTILIDDKVYRVPANEELRKALKLDEEKTDKVFDSIIIGGEAAGLTASIYTPSATASTR